jgi:hypothetical protein
MLPHTRHRPCSIPRAHERRRMTHDDMILHSISEYIYFLHTIHCLHIIHRIIFHMHSAQLQLHSRRRCTYIYTAASEACARRKTKKHSTAALQHHARTRAPAQQQHTCTRRDAGCARDARRDQHHDVRLSTRKRENRTQGLSQRLRPHSCSTLACHTAPVGIYM